MSARRPSSDNVHTTELGVIHMICISMYNILKPITPERAYTLSIPLYQRHMSQSALLQS